MAQETIGQNITFDIYNADGTSFNGLVLHKSTWESVVMSLGDKITGDVYYPTNALVVTMQEYIVYKGVKYSLVNPPTIVREGMASDNSELKGMTKYSFTFYHPMYMLANFPFSDVAVSSDQQRYLSENKTFYWIGNLVDYVAKLNKNLQGTEWCVEIGDTVPSAVSTKLSDVIPFDKQTIADALKTGYETWEVPYVIDIIDSTDSRYAQGKRFLVHFGLPSEEILVENEQHELVPYVFRFGQGVGLKNNSRTPRNNKIVTRISGYGSENNVPYGYPQIPWTGDQTWKYTINNDSTDIHSYPIYDGIVSGQRVKLIKHPFTRTHLMPSIYHDCVNRKVNPYATGYDPTIELKDYYDADNTYDNPINPVSPSYEIHEFEKIKPELVSRNLVAVTPLSQQETKSDYQTMSDFLSWLENIATQTNIDIERSVLHELYSRIQTQTSWSYDGSDEDLYWCKTSFTKDAYYAYVKFESANINFTATVLTVAGIPTTEWDDTMDDDGNYLQSYFQVTIPQLDFDVYACAAVTEEMVINMRSGACLGCSFPVEVDWDDYKKNFYDEDGNFAPDGDQRDLQKYPNSRTGSITLTLKKETETFGTLMPNIYQQPRSGDQFVILGISLPTTYITNAEERLDADMKQYMRDNNVYYFDYPLKFDEHFLATHTGILEQMKPNIVVRFDYAGTTHALYIKQMSVKFGQSPLPQYDITLTDDIEIVLNPIGRVTDEVSNLRILLGQGGGGLLNDNRYLRKDKDDTAQGFIRFIKGLQVGERFVTGLLGEGGVFRKNDDGTTYIETDKLYVRMKAYFDSVEVKHYLHSGGNRIASKAGINCVRVEYIDSNGEITTDVEDAVKFRCYFKAEEDDKSITNDFVIGDLAFCQETNVDVETIDMHRYWRAIVGKSSSANANGEHYIDLSATDCEAGSDVPIAQDDIIQLGNKTDTTRQGAIVEFVGGEDAPSYQIFQGINTYSLSGKNYVGLGYNSGTGRAYLNVYGDTFIGAMPDEHGVSSTYIKYNAGTRSLEIKAKIDAQSTIDGETLAEFIAQNTWTEEQIDALITAGTEPLEDAIEEIQRQVDGSIATWFYDGVPTLNNLPASSWTTADLKNEHLGDLYYDNLTGYAYRFKYDDTNHQWSWGRITDVDVTKALADAAKAQDTADHKRRIFVVQPTPPYDQGDLWVNATYPSGNTETNAAQNKYYNDVLRCNTTKASGTSFAIADWGLASKYTDDQALLDFKANQYVQQLTNGTLNQGISNAQSTASQAALDAAAAQAAADNAQTDADAANDRLDDWADDGVISPTEKTSLKVDWEDMKKEYVQICNDADKYNVSKTAFTSAYTSANAAFQKYTAATPENITIGSDYANIAAYYAARQTIMDAISVAAKKVATDAQAAADAAGNTASSALTAAQAAEAHAATMDAVKQALNQGTLIDGGLVLSTFIGLRDANNTLWSGISGAYSTTGAYGGGLAAWFGGGHVDRRNSDGTWNNVGAKVGFRFDGSGYVAGGAISWDATGLTKVTASKISALEIDLNGDEVATENWVSSNFVSITFFERLFQAYNGSTIVHPNSTSTIDNIKAMFGFWTEQYISALGQGSGGSSGVGDVTWDLLASSSDTRPIALSHLSSALTGGGYSTQSWVQSYVGGLLGDYVSVIYMNNSSAHWSPTNGELNLGNIVKQVKVNGTTYSPNMNGVADLGTIGGGGSGTVTAVKVGTMTYNPTDGVVSLPAYPIGTVTQVKVGTTAYNPSSGVVSLPAYPTTLPASDVSAWAKASTKPAYTLDEVSDGSTRKLANYLPLSGGAMTGVIYGNTGNGLVVQSNSTGSWKEGLRIYPASNNYSVLSLQSSDSRNVFAMVTNVSSNVSYFDYSKNGSNVQILMPYKAGTIALISDIPTAVSQLTNDSNYTTQSWIGQNYLPLTGGKLSRAITTNGDSILKVENTATHGSPRGIEIFTPNNSAFSTPLLMGKEYGTNNMCDIDFIYTSSGSTDNAMSFGFYANDNLIYLKADGNVGIGTTTPSSKLSISGDAADGTPTLMITGMPKAAKWNYTISALASALSAGSVNAFSLGKSHSVRNCGLISYHYIDDGSTSNYLSLHHYGVDDILNIVSDGNVGIGTTSPSSKLHVNGEITATGGTMSGTMSFTTYPCVRYMSGTTAKMNLGYYPTSGYSYFSNETNKYEIRIYDNGNLKYVKWDTGTVYDIWHSGNFSPNDYVTLSTAQTITGVKTFTPTISSSSNSVVYINNTYSGSYARGIDMTFANQPSGFDTPFLFGKSDAKNNKATISFGYAGNQSNSNYIGFGFYANDNILNVTGGGGVGIGTTSPSYTLHVVGNIYATGAVTCLSDIREKNILGQTKITVEQIAKMRSIVYRWKGNGDDREEHVGSIAQDWRSVLPQAVLTSKDEKKTLSMQYGVAALVSAITIARKVVDHERRIKELEDENRKLKEQLKIA